MRDVLDAILYLLRTGCQWRYLPIDFPRPPRAPSGATSTSGVGTGRWTGSMTCSDGGKKGDIGMA
ncbi:transposase [Singulisphaera acidiphila]|uniref:transposase n=1 Tax=Singulisphaera acidiphila TaxID=466153 RepID=UPI0012F9D986